MMVLGVDGGLASFGWALVEIQDDVRLKECGVIKTEKSNRKRNVLASDDNVDRARIIAKFLRGLATVPCVAICAEAMSFPRSSSVAGKMSIAWGVLIGFAVQHDIPIAQASPQQIKKSVCGDKTASKLDVQAAMLKRFGVTVLDHVKRADREHAADACAAVLACLDSDIIRMARQMSR